MNSITLHWLIVDGEHVALVFDRAAFAAFQALAVTQGIETTELITETLARLFGDVFVVRSESAPYN